MNMPRFEPSRAIRSLRSEVDQLFDRFVERPIGAMTGHVIPTIDLSETDTDLIVKADLPGMSEQEIDVSIVENTLTIRGEKTQERKEAGKRYHLVERSYGSFSRSMQLPAIVDADRIKASYRKGVLEILMPKKEQVRTRKVQIQAEERAGGAD